MECKTCGALGDMDGTNGLIIDVCNVCCNPVCEDCRIVIGRFNLCPECMKNTCWKAVLNYRLKNRYTSLFVEGKYKREYNIGKFTRANDNTKLFVFDSEQHALDHAQWKDYRKVLFCVCGPMEEAPEIDIINPFHQKLYGPDNFAEYWEVIRGEKELDDFWDNNIFSLIPIPDGTRLTDWVFPLCEYNADELEEADWGRNAEKRR